MVQATKVSTTMPSTSASSSSDLVMLSKSTILGMVVFTVFLSAISVNVGIFIGDQIGARYYGTTSNSNEGSIVIPHPHLGPRQLTAIANPQQKLDYLLSSIRENTVVGESYFKTIPTKVADLVGLDKDTTAAPEVRAASWLVHKDSTNAQEVIVQRFALAFMYYNNDGTEWTKSDNWLSPTESHCTWYGITCCKNFLFSPVCANVTADPDGITELDMYNNNLSGEIPSSIALLTDLQSIFLSENWLTGSIPQDVFKTLPKLLKLYLQHNNLSGDVPDVHNGILGTLMCKVKGID